MQQDICNHSNDKAQTKFFTSEYYRKNSTHWSRDIRRRGDSPP